MPNTHDPVELIPLEKLLGNPDKFSPRISPDGKYLSYLAPLDGVVNIWLKPLGGGEARPLTNDTHRGIWNYFWAHDCRHLLYTQDTDGNENHRIYKLDVETAQATQLTPAQANPDHPVQAQILALRPAYPDLLVIGLNDRDIRTHDAYLLNIQTGELKLLAAGQPAIMQWLIDHELNVRGYVQEEQDGGFAVMLRAGDSGEFSRAGSWPLEDAIGSSALTFTPDSQRLIMLDSQGRDTAALVEWDPATGNRRVLAEDDEYDMAGVLVHPVTYAVQAANIERERRDWVVLDPAIATDIEQIRSFQRGNATVASRTLDQAVWLVSYNSDTGPIQYYTYDRATREFTFLFFHREGLLNLPLVEMQPISFTARDGLAIHGYLSLPLGWQGPGPLVLCVHGGPWWRDLWGFDPVTQMLANRGYAVLQVNFRGSTGYGKAFVNAGNREWGGKMQDDLTDAVKWAVAAGIADPSMVVIHGGSYGGYATLAGVTFTPELYAAGVSAVGPSNMETFLNTIPPYWENFRRQMDFRVGCIPRHDNGELKQPDELSDAEHQELEFLRSVSPLFQADNVRVPMLIAQGANDPRVVKAESDQFVEALTARGLPVEYVVYEDEGHGFVRPQNRLDFYRRMDRFLAKILGGRCE
ncbi:S9 family peptidase [bacterium]|nr:S9 family peptidase [bacterium]